MAGISKVTIIDRLEKMRARDMGYTIITLQAPREPPMNKDTKTKETSTTKQRIPQALNHQLVRLAIVAKALKRSSS